MHTPEGIVYINRCTWSPDAPPVPQVPLTTCHFLTGEQSDGSGSLFTAEGILKASSGAAPWGRQVDQEG